MRIAQKFEELKAKDERALVLFITAGDPELDELPEILSALEEGGADFIEIGIPFSDPIADGPIIQASSQAALDRGVTPKSVLEAVASTDIGIPLVAMGYVNTALRFGLPRYASLLTQSGFSGAILTDLIPEEATEWIASCGSVSLDHIFLAAPTSTDQRLDKVCSMSTGFVYAVSRTGVTGSNTAVTSEIAGLVHRLKERTALPICIGFGISTPENVRSVCKVADGAIVGSWLVNWLSKNWSGGKGRSELVEKLKALKAATLPRSHAI